MQIAMRVVHRARAQRAKRAVLVIVIEGLVLHLSVFEHEHRSPSAT